MEEAFSASETSKVTSTIVSVTAIVGLSSALAMDNDMWPMVIHGVTLTTDADNDQWSLVDVGVGDSDGNLLTLMTNLSKN